MKSIVYNSGIFYLLYCCTANYFLSGLPFQEPPRTTTTEAMSGPNQCPSRLDVAFAIDASYSVAPYFQKTLQLVKEFSSIVSVSQDDYHISVLQFSSDANVEFYLCNGTSIDDVTTMVDAIQYKAGSTETGLALLALREQIFIPQRGDRTNVPDLIILITDGTASDHDVFISESKRLHASKNTLVLAVSVGFLTNPQELHAVAGDHNVFSSTRLDDVVDLSRDIVNRICSVFGQVNFSASSPQSDSKEISRQQQIVEDTPYPPTPTPETGFTYNVSDFLNASTTFVPQTLFSSSIHNNLSISQLKNMTENKLTGCQIKEAMDLVFVVDSSKNVAPSSSRYISSFLLSLSDTFQMDSPSGGLQRVGIIQYSDDAVKVMSLAHFNSSKTYREAVSAMRYIGGNSNLAAALNVLESEVLTAPRAGVARVGVIITGGLTTQRDLVRLHARILHHNDVNIIVLGIGDQVSRENLDVLASQPKDEHIFMVANLTYGKDDAMDGAISSLCASMTNLTRTAPNASPNRQPINDGDNIASLRRELINTTVASTRETNNSECVDTIPNCQDYGKDVCYNPTYREWAEKHCSKHCRICDVENTMATPTSVRSNSSSNVDSMNATTNQDSHCVDVLPDCENYGGPSVCQNFSAWASVRCQRYCGFCTHDNATQPTMEAKALRCPQWMLPAECSLKKVTWSECSMPSCPPGYVLTAIPQG